MDSTTFKIFAENLARMARGELVTREELRRELERLEGVELEGRVKQLIEEKLESIERGLDELDRKVERFNKQLKLGINLYCATDLEEGLLYTNFKVEGGKPVIVSLEEKVEAISLEEKVEVKAELVTAGSFGKLAEEILARLEGQEKGFVVLEGPKGIGKSTLAAYVAWLALLRGWVDAIIHVAKLDVGEASKLRNFVELTLSPALSKGSLKGRFIVLYDPSPLHAYYELGAFPEEMRKAVEAVERTLRELLKLAKSGNNVCVLAVLPSDLYESLSQKLKGELDRFILCVNLRDPLFLEEVIKAYLSCEELVKAYSSSGVLRRLAERIAEFEGGYTLVAKYAGLWLRNEGGKVEDIEKVLEEAEGKPKLFLAHYLWSVLLKENEDLAMKVAAPLLLHAAFGPIPEGLVYLTKASLKDGRWRFLGLGELEGASVRELREVREAELEPLAKWLSIQHEDLVEEILRELCGFKAKLPAKWFSGINKDLIVLDRDRVEKMLKGLHAFRELYEKQLPELTGALSWALGEILRETLHEIRVIYSSSKTVFDASSRHLQEFAGRRLEAALKAQLPNCWLRLALIPRCAYWQFYFTRGGSGERDFETL